MKPEVGQGLEHAGLQVQTGGSLDCTVGGIWTYSHWWMDLDKELQQFELSPKGVTEGFALFRCMMTRFTLTKLWDERVFANKPG